MDRILDGSDWPVCLFAAEYKKQMEITGDYIAKYSTEDKAKIMGSIAINFNNINF